MAKQVTENKKESNALHFAKASARSLPVSTKHSIEICNAIRYKTTTQARKILEDAFNLKTAIPFKRFNRDMGHKAGMASGRYPVKAIGHFLKLIKSVEANAQVIGLNTANLKIQKILANKAAIPTTGGRNRRATKRTNLDVEVKEVEIKKKKVLVKKAKPIKKETTKKEIPTEQKIEIKPIEKEVIKNEEVKTEVKESKVEVQKKVVEKSETSKTEEKIEKKTEEKIPIKEKIKTEEEPKQEIKQEKPQEEAKVEQ